MRVIIWFYPSVCFFMKKYFFNDIDDVLCTGLRVEVYTQEL